MPAKEYIPGFSHFLKQIVYRINTFARTVKYILMGIINYFKRSLRRKKARRITSEYPPRIDVFHFDNIGEIEFANWDNPLYAPIELNPQMVDFFKQFIKDL